MKQKAKKAFFITLGTLFLIIGFIGIFLPLLPTTPLLILAAICYNQGSPKFHSWLLNHKVFGPPILDWQKRRVIRTKYKILSTTMMLASFAYVAPKPNVPIVGKVSFGIFILGMLSFIWTRKSR